MDRQATLRRIGAEFTAAGAARDWARLDAAARALAPQLAALAASGPWSAAERAALTQLRTGHDQAAAACAGALDALGSLLEEMRTNKEGWIAYALGGDSQPGLEP
jgi:hypothetical protein